MTERRLRSAQRRVLLGLFGLFLAAEAGGRRDHALAAAVYAYAFLFGSRRLPVHPFDPRIQVARGLYNRGLTLGLADERRDHVAIESARYELPFGVLDIVMEPGATQWAGWQMVEFRSAADVRVRGLRNRYRQAGIGAPQAASIAKPEGAELPIAPGVTAHSIIAVRGGPPPAGGSDGVVRFESAHIEGVESELVVDADHSVQMQQRAIQELRRILLEHVGATP